MTTRRVRAPAVAMAMFMAMIAVEGVPGCGARGPAVAVPPPIEVPLEATALEVARLEVARGASVPRLRELVAGGSPATRLRAIRALGRIGGSDAIAVLSSVVARDAAPSVEVAAAAAAVGVIAATSDPTEDEAARLAEVVLLAARNASLTVVDRVVVAEALGRAGNEHASPGLTRWVADAEDHVAASAALALGRFGRRKLELADGARDVLQAAALVDDREVRYAAAYALGREVLADDAAPDEGVIATLVTLLTDRDEEIRATAIAGLARRKAVAGAETVLIAALDDDDPRVAVEAVRALGGPHGSAAGRAAVATRLPRWAHAIPTYPEASAHPLLEGLRALATGGAAAEVRTAFSGVLMEAASALSRHVPARSTVPGWAHCLAVANLERARPDAFDGGARVMACGGGLLSAGDRARLLADLTVGLIDDGAVAARGPQDVTRSLLGSADARVRAAGLAVLAKTWATMPADERGVLAETLAMSLDAESAIEVGTAAETLGALLELAPRFPGFPQLDPLSAAREALFERAIRETDPELAASLLGVIGTAKVLEGVAACVVATRSASPVRAAAGAECATALGHKAEATPRAGPAPPVDPAAVIGRQVRWHLRTSRGEIEIELDPEVAPWNVATLVSLTQRGFYDGLVFHRVVPDFVIQTGDPTGTGWGGPGFTTPAEPSTILDDNPFEAGAVGIADAGKDSGGSQWFVMNSRAPHLEGRYTQVGRVVKGQDVVDQIVVGDVIDTATVEVR